jgi:serine/threonine-protein kinase RsbW
MSRTARISVPADTSILAIVGHFVSQMAKLAGMGEEDVFQIELAVDEACTNVIIHGYDRDASQSFSVTCRFDEETLSVEVKDRGKPFDFDELPYLSVVSLEEER